MLALWEAIQEGGDEMKINRKADQWHPWQGSTPIVSAETMERFQGFPSRQTLRKHLRTTLGDAEGKREYRRIRGLEVTK